MQESRRRRWLQLYLLPLALSGAACGGSAPTATTPEQPAEPAPLAEPVASAPTASSAAAPAELAATPAPHAAPADSAPVEPPALPAGTKVLQVGDSFADALSKELNKLLKEAGLLTTVETKTPSYIGDWAYGDVLPKLLARHKPDLVLITLGANELEIPEPELRATPIKRLVGRLAGRPCVWILPPLWKADTGVMQVIKDNASPCQVLDSTALVGNVPRGPDGIHPSTKGRADWAASVVGWLRARRDPDGPTPWALRSGS